MELTIEEALQQAVTAHKEGKIQEAESLYRVILRSEPKHPDANHNLGVLAISVNKTVVGLPLLKTALEANPKMEQFWLSYIDALIKGHQYGEAKRVSGQAKKRGLAKEKLKVLGAQLESIKKQKNVGASSPSREQLRNLLEHYQAGRLEDAEKLATSITKKCPAHPFSWQVLGAVLKQTGRIAESLTATQKSVQFAPQDAGVHSQLGVTLQELGRLEEAEASYRRAIVLKPDYAEAHYNLGNTLKELGRLEEAEASFTQAIALKPDFAEAHYNLGNTFKDLGRLEEAVAQHTKVIALRPDYAEAYSNLGSAQKGLGRLEEARDSFTQAIALRPDYAQAHSNLGITLQELRRLDEAEASHTRAITLKPDYAQAHSNLGITLKELGRLDEAEASYIKAVELNPDYAEAHSNLGITLQELGRLDEAEASYIQAIALKPDYAEAHSNLGITLKELGRLEEAEASYTQAIALKPDFAKTYDDLGDLLQILGKFEDAEVRYKEFISLAPFEDPITKSKASILFAQGEFQKALSLFDSYGTPESRSLALECLHVLGKTEEIFKRIEDTAELDDGNLRVAAFATFIAESQQKDTAHRFCKKPLEFVHFSNLASKMENPSSFITNLVEDLKDIKAVWQPRNQSANGGFQTDGNLFRYSNRNIAILKEVILTEIDVYYEKFRNQACSFIEKWPAEKNIKGWHIMLKEQGYHHRHIHQGGWLSGVVYLKVAPSLEKNEGAITFNLARSDIPYPNLPTKIHNPEIGDIVLFPSSLYHGTIPFSTDTDRIVVSFDLEPGQKNRQ